jgi:hypothetical protein
VGSSKGERGDLGVARESADPIAGTIRYVDGIFGSGTGERHVTFLDRLENEALREAVHRCHAMEADTTHLSLEENYLLGMSVLAALRSYGTAAMFAKVLLHLGSSRAKISAAVGRLSMWVGPLPSAEAALIVQRAMDEYEREGIGSLGAWFPDLEIATDSVTHHAETLRPAGSPASDAQRPVPGRSPIK